MKKYHLITFGCQMNQSDSKRIALSLENMGYKPAPLGKGVSLIVVNACSVRQSAVDRIYGKIKDFKKTGAKILLTGCVLKKDFISLKSHFDYIFSINSLGRWKEFLKYKSCFFYPDPINKKQDMSYLKAAQKSKRGFSALVPISAGCNNFCSFCVVPYTRGPERSRKTSEVLEEIKKLLKKGVKEVWLLGQNVNSYQYKNINFAKLLRKINKIEGDFWIRFTSSHPKDFSRDIIEAIKDCPKAAEYINLPLQSGDSRVLKKMNRPYSPGQYKNLVKQIRKQMPDVCLSTDIIVGFPGETKKQFENTRKLFEEIKFDMAYIARYSPRPRTAAFLMKDNVSNKEKKRREKELTKILEKTALENNKKMVGKEIEVLIESCINGFCVGKSKNYKTVKVKSNRNIEGKKALVKINGALAWGLQGALSKKKPSPKSARTS